MTIPLADLRIRYPENGAIRASKLNDLITHIQAVAAIVSDGDKGDITVSGAGTVWTIDDNTVTFAKMQDIATDRLIGRSTAGTGNPEEITCTAAGRALIDDANAAAQRTTLGLVIGTDVQAYDDDLQALANASSTGYWYFKKSLTAWNPVQIGTGLQFDAASDTLSISDPELTALIGLVSAADRLPYYTGFGTAALATFTAAGRALVDDADATAQRATLGLTIGTNVQAFDATLSAFAGYNTNGILTQTAADTFTGRTITGTANEITVADGSGVGGNPTLSLPTSLTFTGKTVTGGTFTTVASISSTGSITTTGTNIQVKPAASGGIQMVSGTNVGFLRLINADGSSGSILGFVSGTRTELRAAGGATGWKVTGDVIGDDFIKSNSSSAGIGYDTGAGGTVTQITSKATGVTLNKVTGQITMNNAALAAATSVAFTLTNSSIAATDVIIVNIKSGGTSGAYTVTVEAVAAGSCKIMLRNESAGSLSEAVVLQFAVIKGVNA